MATTTLKHLKTFESFNNIESNETTTDEGLLSWITGKDEELWKELSNVLKIDKISKKPTASNADIINFVKTNKMYDKAVKRINKGEKSGKLPENADILNKAVETRINDYKINPEKYMDEIISLLIAAKAAATGNYMAYVVIGEYDISDVKAPKVLKMSFSTTKTGSSTF